MRAMLLGFSHLRSVIELDADYKAVAMINIHLAQ